MNRQLTLLLSLVLTSAALGQMSPQIAPTVRQGMMSAAAAGLIWRDPSNGSSELVIRNAGSNPATPTEWSAATYGLEGPFHPDYSIAGITESWPPYVGELELSEVSTGGDICPPVDGSGRLQMNGLWYGLSILVAPGARGVQNSLIEQFSGALGGTVFSYYAEGSTGISDAYIGRTFIEQTATQLGYPGPTADILGLDWGIGVASVDPQKRSIPLFPFRDQLYFVVTREFAEANQHITFPDGASGWLTPVPINAASVYVQYWSCPAGTNAGSWSAPMLAYSFADLGLTFSVNPYESDAIDMLSVYNGNGNNRVVFSTAVTVPPHRDQILVFQRATSATMPDCPTTALRTYTGAKVSDKIGLHQGDPQQEIDPDEVRGGCGKDPEALAFSAMLGIPAGSASEGPNPLGLSITRREILDASGATTENSVFFEVSGMSLGSSPVGAVEFQLCFPDPNANDDAVDQWISFHLEPVFPGQTTASLALPAMAPLGVPLVKFKARQYVYQPANGQWALHRESVVSTLRY